jgi:hypothetical protein
MLWSCNFMAEVLIIHELFQSFWRSFYNINFEFEGTQRGTCSHHFISELLNPLSAVKSRYLLIGTMSQLQNVTFLVFWQSWPFPHNIIEEKPLKTLQNHYNSCCDVKIKFKFVMKKAALVFDLKSKFQSRLLTVRPS